MRGFTIAQTMHTIDLGLQNARNVTQIRVAIGRYGYNEKRLQKGDSLYQEVEDLRTIYDFKAFDAKEKQQAWKQKDKEAYALYMEHLKLTRCALANSPSLWNKMAMNGRRAYSFDGWTHQAKTLYKFILANPSILDKLSRYKITRENIEKGLQLIKDATSLHHAHIRLKALAKTARVQWDKALQRLKQWYSVFRSVLRIALKDTPWLLKALGIPVKLSAMRLKASSPEVMPPAALRGLSEGAYAAGTKGRRPLDPLYARLWMTYEVQESRSHCRLQI